MPKKLTPNASSMPNIAINGFGRIGRAVYRILSEKEGVEVVVAAGGAWAAGSGRLRKALGTTACLIYASPARSVSCK